MPIVEVDIREIIEVADSLNLSSFLTTANLIRVEDLAGKGLSEARLDQIELYLAAHFTALRDEHGALKSSETLSAKDSYFGDYGRGLRATRYGQQAILMDTSGTLAVLAEPSSKAQFRVV